MSSGRYKNRVSIRRLKSTATQDAHGQIDNTDADNWEEVCSTWVGCVSRGGREFWKVDRLEADVTHVWTSRYFSTLATATPADRLVETDGTEHNIVSVINIDNAGAVMEIQTKRAVM